MTARIALCIDEPTCTHPETIGLGGEALDSQEWLSVHVGGQVARSALKDNDEVEEVWVASCDDVEPINLAATLKSDCAKRAVRLVCADTEGSILSRAHAAAIDEVMNQATFVKRYQREKGRDLVVQPQLQTDEPPQPKAELLPAPPTEAHTEPQRVLAFAAQGPALHQGSGFLLPVVSGSGGAGKSTVSLLAAQAAHALGCKTLLLDYDLQFGDVAQMAGIEDSLAIDEALAWPDKLTQEANRTDRFALLSAPTRLEMSEGIVRALPELLATVMPLFDVVVANTGAAWAEQHAVLLEHSSATLFLVDQRSSSIRACRHALELCGRCGIATGQFQFVLNRCSKNSPLTSVDVSCALQGAPVAELRDGGRDVEEYLAAGALSDLAESGNELYTSVCRLMAQTLPNIDSQPENQPTSSRGRIASKRKGRHAPKRRGWGK